MRGDRHSGRVKARAWTLAPGGGGRKGLLESHVRDLPAGIYAVRLVVEGMVWGHNKFTVVR